MNSIVTILHMVHPVTCRIACLPGRFVRQLLLKVPLFERRCDKLVSADGAAARLRR
jgi:hypothetical protein